MVGWFGVWGQHLGLGRASAALLTSAYLYRIFQHVPRFVPPPQGCLFGSRKKMAASTKPTCSRALRLVLPFALVAFSQAEDSLVRGESDLSLAEIRARNPGADGTLANALKPAEDTSASQRILIVDGSARQIDKVACNLVYYENATSGS